MKIFSKIIFVPSFFNRRCQFDHFGNLTIEGSICLYIAIFKSSKSPKTTRSIFEAFPVLQIDFKYLFWKWPFLKIFGSRKNFWQKFQNFYRFFRPRSIENFQKSTKSVSETSPIHLDSHYKLVELAEICRLVVSEVKSEVGNIVKFSCALSKFKGHMKIFPQKQGTMCTLFLGKFSVEIKFWTKIDPYVKNFLTYHPTLNSAIDRSRRALQLCRGNIGEWVPSHLHFF